LDPERYKTMVLPTRKRRRDDGLRSLVMVFFLLAVTHTTTISHGVSAFQSSLSPIAFNSRKSIQQEETTSTIFSTAAECNRRCFNRRANIHLLAAKKKKKSATGSAKKKKKKQNKKGFTSLSARSLDDNGLQIVTDEDGRVTARPANVPTISVATVEKETDESNVEMKTVQQAASPVGESKHNDATASETKEEATKIARNIDEKTPITKKEQKTKEGIETDVIKDDQSKLNKPVTMEEAETIVAEVMAKVVRDTVKEQSRIVIKNKKSKDNKMAALAQTEPRVEKQTSIKTGNDATGVVDVVTEVKEQRTDTPVTKSKSSTPDETNTAANTAETKLVLKKPKLIVDQPAKVVPVSGFNVVLTHCTADFDTLASAVGLAKLWSANTKDSLDGIDAPKKYDSSSDVPTFVVLPRGAHPGVQRFLALHKHLFPIRSLKSLPSDLSGLNRLGLVDAQRRDRVGPAEHLLGWAKRVTVVDHHVDAESDIPEATDYVVDKVGSVSTLIAERLKEAGIDLTEAESTLMALGIHADTGSLCFDSTTPRDAMALAWLMGQGASQTAIAEHALSSLSPEQQGVLTQALININSTEIHGVTVSSVLLSADGFINGLAAVTHDALELSSSDVFLLAVVYEARSGGSKKKSKKEGEIRMQAQLFEAKTSETPHPMEAGAWMGGEIALKRRRLQASFDRKDIDGSGYLDRSEIAAALASSGVITSEESINTIFDAIDTDGDGQIDFEEFVTFALDAEKRKTEADKLSGKRASTMIIIGRVKSGVNVKQVNLNDLFEPFGGGGHPKAASTTVQLGDDSEAQGVLQGIVDELIGTSLLEQPTVGDFMTSPVLSAKPTMTEKQVEDLFTRYDVRALPVIDDNNDVVGLVTYKEVAAAKQRLWNKEQKRLRREAQLAAEGKSMENNKAQDRKLGSALKGWMKQHVQLVEASSTMAEVEAILLETDVGCIPVVADGTKQLLGMVTRTDVLRQHRYYPSLHYHNKGFADSIAARKPIIELRRKLKQFDIDE